MQALSTASATLDFTYDWTKSPSKKKKAISPEKEDNDYDGNEPTGNRAVEMSPMSPASPGEELKLPEGEDGNQSSFMNMFTNTLMVNLVDSSHV
jgi:hypothetical protein